MVFALDYFAGFQYDETGGLSQMVFDVKINVI
jgi:hypothetical protein